MDKAQNKFMQKKRPLERKNFKKKFPHTFALLNVLRRSLFTDNHFSLVLGNKFSITEKEYDIWGHLAEKHRFIRVEPAKGDRYRCLIDREAKKTLLEAIKNIRTED